jgi:hypothetical protein
MARIFASSHELVDHIEGQDHDCRLIARAPDGSPVVAVRAGGSRTPAVFITAGSHSTEQAGVTAAVQLVDELQTEHQVWVIPTRDPMGMNGYCHTLEWALGEAPGLASRDDLADLLRERGDVVIDEEDVVVALINEFAFTTRNLLGRFKEGDAALVEPLKGRRIFVPSGHDDVAGAAPLERAYTLIVSPQGEVLHVNRFHDTEWAPAEVRATRRLLADVQPGICFDLHESMGIQDRYWLSARKQRTAELDKLEADIATAVIGRIAASGTQFMADDYLPGRFFTSSEPGVFWLDAMVRGEGLNLMDYAAREYGIAFGTEMGMFGTFDNRVAQAMLTVQSAVAAWEAHR